MDLDPPTPWASLVETFRATIRLVAHPGASGIATSGLRPANESVILAIGPEGGFTADEVDRAVAAGWRMVGLGSTLLRIETAALSGCSTLLALSEPDGEGEGM